MIFKDFWADFGGLKSPAQMHTEVASFVAQGARCDIGDQVHPDDRFDPAVYHVIGQAPYCRGLGSTLDLGSQSGYTCLMPTARYFLLFLLCTASLVRLLPQQYGQPDRGEPGDLMIQRYLESEAEALELDFLGKVATAQKWTEVRQRYQREFLDMLGLWPLPEKQPLQATVTRTLDRGDYVVEMLHYQSRPGLYVTANLYRPARVQSGERLPAIVYVCGHSGRGRNGNKTAFQSHGIWFARHAYVCLVLDTLQLGEIAGVHHGTYREGRWWWLSRGYTPAGVECWNGVRGIDYLVSRPDVDPERIGVTGISGGGAATFWIAGADDRVKVAVPVSGMADLVSYIPNRLVNGHCDCMFLYNTYQWPWTRIAALIAPRPMLFVNSDNDPIFPMDANERVINRLERLYSLFEKGDWVDSFVSIGGHDYRQDIRQAVYRFMNLHLKADPRPISDSEIDLVTGDTHPIPPEQLRVFPQNSDVPAGALNAQIDQEFVRMANVPPPGSADGAFEAWKNRLLARLRNLTFHHFPERIMAARPLDSEPDALRLETESGIEVRVGIQRPGHAGQNPARILLWVTESNATEPPPAWVSQFVKDGDALFACEPRGVGASQWTRKDPPNYVERSCFLLGRTVDSGRVWDVVAVARHLRARFAGQAPVIVLGEKRSAVLAIYAALLEPDICELILSGVPATHMEPSAPALMNVLRVCDIPEALGMVAPRTVTLLSLEGDWINETTAIFRAAGVAEKLLKH